MLRPPHCLQGCGFVCDGVSSSRTIEKYIEAIAIWGYDDYGLEADMIKEFWRSNGWSQSTAISTSDKGHQFRLFKERMQESVTVALGS